MKKWLQELWESRDAPREKPSTFYSFKERDESETESEEDSEDAHELEAAAAEGTEKEKQTLEFGRAAEGGAHQLIGYCEVQKRGFVEACQWRVEPLKPRQKGPVCKIKF